MPQKKSIIVVANPAWKGNYIKSTVELTKELAKHTLVENVLYVDYQRTWKDLIFDFKNSPVLQMLGLKSKISYEEGVLVFTPPPILPINWIKNQKIYEFFAKLNAKLLKKHINKAADNFKFKNRIVINAFNPVYGFYLNKQLKEDLTVYYCYDEISASKWVSQHGVRFEKKFIKKVDLTICSSLALTQEKLKYGQRVVTIKNGAPFELYYKHFKAEKYDNITKPIIGYTGSIDDRLDYEILEHCIKTIPGATFKMIGPVSDNRAYELKKYPNVIFTGGLTHEPYSKELNTLHLAIIPFIRNKFTDNCNVLKINDYFAAGMPVVSTKFGDIEDWKEHISIVNEKVKFVEAIRKEINNINSVKAAHKTSIGRENSWVNRADVFINQMIKCL